MLLFYGITRKIIITVAVLVTVSCISLFAASNSSVSYSLPFNDDFDGVNNWTVQTFRGSSWQAGTPSFGQTSSAHSGTTSWDIDLDSSYSDSSFTILTSPLIDFPGVYNANLSFWQNYNTQEYFDGTRLEYSIDGFSWMVLGNASDPNATNWYTLNNISSSNQAAWSGNSGGWIHSSYTLVPLNGYTGQVQFRFIFTSNDSLNLDGHSLDDFSIDLAPNQDATIASILSPLPYAISGTPDSIKVIIRNTGGFAFNSLSLSCSLNGSPIATQLWNGNLDPALTDTVVFSTMCIVQNGSFSVCASVQLPSDGNANNDTLYETVYGLSRNAIPFSDSFDSALVDWKDRSVAGTSWQLGTPSYGVTNSAWSGSKCWDINLSTPYMDHALSYLYSPFFDLTGLYNSRLSFMQNRNTEKGYDGFLLESSSDAGSTWQQVGVFNEENSINWFNDTSVSSLGNRSGWDDRSYGWKKSSCVLSSLNNAGNKVQFRFLFASDGSNGGDGCSIDDFKIDPAPSIDLSINKIISPATQLAQGTSDSIRIRVRNIGYSVINSFTIQYGVIGESFITYNWIGSLQASDAIDLSIDTMNYRGSDFTLRVIISALSDADASNDTLDKNLFGIPVLKPPFYDDMEGARNFYADPNDAEWQWGTPNSNLIDHPYNGSKCWKTNLGGDYNNRDRAELFSPYFDFSNAYHAVLKFRQWYSTEYAKDGGRLEYSKDAGQNWKSLGSRSDLLATNWFTSNNIFSSGKPGWDGNSNGWLLSTYNLDSLSGYSAGLVQFRFVFTSNDSVTANGWAIDDFCIISMPAISAMPTTCLGLPDPFQPVGSYSLRTYVKNTGAFPLNSIRANLLVDGILQETDSISIVPSLSTGDSVLHSFSLRVIFTGGLQHICIATTDPNSIPDQFAFDDSFYVDAGVFDTVSSTAFPWCDDLESLHTSWLTMHPTSKSFLNSVWEKGGPQKTYLNSTHSGNNSWATYLTYNYLSHAHSALYSPVFQLDSAACYRLKFWEKYKTELFQDGGTVEYSIDAGNTWIPFGAQGEVSWFNSSYITGLNLPPVPGWSGTSNGWVQAEHELYFPFKTSIVFRFRFGSDASVQDEGWEIDDVCLDRLTSCSIGIEEVELKEFSIYPNPVSDNLHIEFNNAEKINSFEFKLINSFSQILFQKSVNKNSFEIDLSRYPSGIYFLIIDSGQKRLVKRIIKLK